MTVQELKNSFQYGMHGCGSFRDTLHSNSLEAFNYWLARGVKFFEIDIAVTSDRKFIALGHMLNPHFLKNVEINPYTDKSEDKYSESWFMRNKLCRKTTGGLTPMNLESVVEKMAQNPDIIVMFDLWGMWEQNDTRFFSQQLLDNSPDHVVRRCILEVYNKKMLAGIRNVSRNINTVYCVHGSSTKEFDENVSPSILKKLGVDIISYPWICTMSHPGELKQYHNEGFTVISLSRDNRYSMRMKKDGVNINLVDNILSKASFIQFFSKKISMKMNRVLLIKEQPVMKEMTLQEQHAVALDIMKEIHSFCVENDIKYSLAYGSLLGAIRHNGFIPWDDDIDIWMTRPNFEKFTRSFKSKRGYRHVSVYDKDSLICFDRVYEIDHTYVKNMPKACDGKTGIWVDVMLLENVPDDVDLRNKQYMQFALLNKKIDIFRGWLTNVENQGQITKFKLFCKILVDGNLRYLSRRNIGIIHSQQLKLISEYSSLPSSNYCFFQCGVLYRNLSQELLPTLCFQNYITIDFEDTKLMIVKDYDPLLKLLFGDYMTLPPENQRQKSHGKCFWK